MCIPDGDSCPGCEKPLVDQWKSERAAVPDGLELAAKWHEQRSELFRQEAAVHEERYNNTKDDFPKAAETHLRRWGHAQNSQVDHIECAAAIRKLAAPQPPEGAL